MYSGMLKRIRVRYLESQDSLLFIPGSSTIILTSTLHLGYDLIASWLSSANLASSEMAELLKEEGGSEKLVNHGWQSQQRDNKVRDMEAVKREGAIIPKTDGSQLQENIDLLCRTKDNIERVHAIMRDMPGRMRQMRELPVSIDQELADRILPCAAQAMLF